MNRIGLAKVLAEKLSVTQATASEIAQAWEQVMKEALLEDGELSLFGFGTFSIWDQVERVGRNPRNGEVCMIRPRASVKFKPGSRLLAELNHGSYKKKVKG